MKFTCMFLKLLSKILQTLLKRQLHFGRKSGGRGRKVEGLGGLLFFVCLFVVVFFFVAKIDII